MNAYNSLNKTVKDMRLYHHKSIIELYKEKLMITLDDEICGAEKKDLLQSVNKGIGNEKHILNIISQYKPTELEIRMRRIQ